MQDASAGATLSTEGIDPPERPLQLSHLQLTLKVLVPPIAESLRLCRVGSTAARIS